MSFAATDRECLRSFARERSAAALAPVVQRYAPLVYAAALRRTHAPERAADVTRAVFVVLARRARRLGKRTLLARWLYDVTAVACRKAGGRVDAPRWRWFGWFRRSQRPIVSGTAWEHVGPEIDAAMDRLSRRRRSAVLLLRFLALSPRMLSCFCAPASAASPNAPIAP